MTNNYHLHPKFSNRNWKNFKVFRYRTGIIRLCFIFLHLLLECFLNVKTVKVLENLYQNYT